jgi:ABC-type transport system involved in cytochrome bd biosynthesis fused ATPase/permease subunit
MLIFFQAIALITKFLNYTDVNRLKFWLGYSQLIFISIVDFILLGLTGFIVSKLVVGLINSIPLYIQYIYVSFVILRLFISTISQSIYIDCLFNLREEISKKYIKKVLLDTSGNGTKISSNVILTSYLNEFIFSLCIPLTTIFIELLLLFLIIIFSIYYVGHKFIYLIPFVLLLLPLVWIIKTSQHYGRVKSEIENNVFSQLNCYINSNLEIITLGSMNYILHKIKSEINLWMNNIRKHYLFSTYPKLYIENLIFVLIMVILIFNNSFFSIGSDLNLVASVLILPILRTLPSFGRIATSVQQIKYGIPHCDHLYAELLVLDGNKRFEEDSSKNINNLVTINSLNNDLFLRVDGSFLVNNTEIKINSFVVKRNSIYKVNGKSGSGKSTFLKNLSGVVFSNKLIITYFNNFDKNSIIYLPDRSLIISGSLYENLILDNNLKNNKYNINYVLNLVGLNSDNFELDTRLTFNGTNISTGQRQRIGLARAILKNPSLLMIDEGISNLPIVDRIELITKLYNIGMSIIIVDHSNEYTAANIENWIINGHEIRKI